MQVTIETNGPIERRLTVSVPHTEIAAEIHKRLQAVGKRARLPGFRPGKAPPTLIQQRYRAQITNEVVADTIKTTYPQALKQQSLTPAGLLSIDPKPLTAGADLQYTATIELYPDIPSPTLAGAIIRKPSCPITPADIDRTITDIRHQHADFHPKTTPAEPGDRLTVAFTGHINDTPFPGGTADNHRFILGQNHPFPPFDTELLATTPDTVKHITFTLPLDYPVPDLIGKPVTFHVTVKAVDRRVIPSLDAAFADRLGITGGIPALRDQVKTRLQHELAARLRDHLHDQVMAELLKLNPIQAPKSLIEAEIDHRITLFTDRLAASSPPSPSPPSPPDRALFTDLATRHVTLALIVGDIITKAALKPDPAAVRARVEELATAYDDADAIIRWHYADPARLRRIEAATLEDQVVTHLLTTADLQEHPQPLQDFLTPQPPPSNPLSS